MSKLFISHSSEDDDFVRGLRQGLADLKQDGWVDSRELRGGDPLWSEIQTAIEGASAYAVVVSTNGLQSKWVGKELRHALEMQKQRGRDEFPVIPLSLNNTKLGVLEEFFGEEPVYIPVSSDAGGIDAALNAIRVALGLTLTAAGIAHIFMGQEFLEDKQWDDQPGGAYQIWWDGTERDQAMVDFLRFTRELFAVRKSRKGLTGGGLNVFHVHNGNRVLAFHRWVPGDGHDVVVVASLNESTYYGYELGLPRGGYWREVFNSDVYDNWENPMAAGNGGGVHASGGALHGLPASARVTIPANSFVVLAG